MPLGNGQYKIKSSRRAQREKKTVLDTSAAIELKRNIIYDLFFTF
jgi:hypothetical protein